jgi:hypothetical protein
VHELSGPQQTLPHSVGYALVQLPAHWPFLHTVPPAQQLSPQAISPAAGLHPH